MKTKLRVLSAFLILSMIFPILSGIYQPVLAAMNIPIKVYIDDFNKSTATAKISWDPVDSAVTTNIYYHIPTSTGYSEVKVDAAQIDTINHTATITKIKNDIIYDFYIEVVDDSGQVYSGQNYFLSQVSVYAEQVEQQQENMAGGGVETGVHPTIKLSWNMPKVFVPTIVGDHLGGGSMLYANETDKGTLSQIDGLLDKLNFSFNLNVEDESLTSIQIVMDKDVTALDSKYKAYLSGNLGTQKYSNVKWEASSGKYSFYILGLKDNNADVPSRDEIVNGTYTIPNKISQVGDEIYVLPHNEVRPGTVYQITMNTLFTDANDKSIDAVNQWTTENPLIGAVDYTYTPIRFSLTKDNYNTIYVKIYRINEGGIMPKLYYYVQTSNTSSNQDSSWTQRKKLDDTFFGDGEYAITGIAAGIINPKNTVYYRVVVKSEGITDQIKSLNLEYTMQNDTAVPPVPNKISITGVDLVLPPTGITDTSSNITISWDKPSNWDQILADPANDVYFNFLINVSEKDSVTGSKPTLEANGKTYGQYDTKYRLVKYVSAQSYKSSSSDKIKVSADGTKLIYTLKGYELFTWVNKNGTTVDSLGKVQTIPNDDNYPSYLLPNKTYYLQMYTTNTASSNMSERSLTTSFTTLSPSGKDVPTPKNLEWVKTTINPSTTTKPTVDATVDIRFDAPKIVLSDYTSDSSSTNYQIFYDLYMSTNTTDFRVIGTTQSKGDVTFSNQILQNTTWFTATINQFTGDNKTRFGSALAPNSTYYFMVKARIVDENQKTVKQSIGTALLSVTTPRGEATIPDNTALRPVAPTDFAIALDNNGDPMVDGQSVTFEWTVKENAAAYHLIATTNKVNADDTLDAGSSILQDTTYNSFISALGSKDNDGDKDNLILNPNDSKLPANFSYDSTTKKCRYTINTWLYPNKVYYFTLRSEIGVKPNTKTSVWVSIPVTTSLIESPTKLQVVNDCELAFYWSDNTAGMTAENYSISIKASDSNDYTLLAKSQYTIVKKDSVYYARTTPAAKLKANTQYGIKIVRTIDNVVLSTLVKSTRDDYYQIDVRWQGYAIDAYSGFEIAIRTENDTDYTVLKNSVDLEWYRDISTHDYPYYIEKETSNLGNNYYMFNARIKLAPTKLSDGTVEHRPLIPNTKYYIKVRAVKTDSSNSTAVTPSKYVGPVDTRTEFNQDDYDDEDNHTSIEAKFLDMLDKLEQDVVWDISKQNGVTNKVLVRDDKVINLLEGYGFYSCTIDMSQSADYINSDEIYLAKDILEAMKSNDRSIIIRTKNAEFTVRPETFNVDDMEEFKSAEAVTGSKDIYLKLSNIQSTSIVPSIPKNTTDSSKMSVLSAQAIVSKKTSASINAQIKDKLYNDKTGIVQKKVAIIKNPNNLNVQKETEEVNKYLNQLCEEVKSELSYYIEDTLNGTGYASGVLADKFDISKFSSPLGVKMKYKAGTISNPYVSYGNVANWKKLTQNVKAEDGYLSYFVTGPGKYAIFSSKDITATLANDSEAKPYISKLAGSYDLTTVFPEIDVSFNPDLKVTVKEGILLYELLLESQNNEQTDAKVKAKAYGLDKIINITNLYRNLTRQEAAAITIKLYCQKTGADYDKLKASYSKLIKDDSKIDDKYAIPVYVCLQMNIMTLDSSANFNPKATINRAEVAMVLQKMLET